MVFLYKPIRSNKFYKEGLEYIRNDNYSEAEASFKRATLIYPKIYEYDNYGWEYLLSGNYDAAEKKFEQGILLDTNLKNLNLREHLALLYNILHRYEDADTLYNVLIEKKPTYYYYTHLKGRNLIDWGKQEEIQLENAYTLFKEEAPRNQKNSDPLFQMLYIDILRKNSENIDYLYGFLRDRYPQYVNKEVYTELASYYISKNLLDPVWDIMSSVVKNQPDYPKAYYVFSLYNKAINNKKDEEALLIRAIDGERNRELVYPWDKRDRKLLSNAYNNLGELYSGMEIPGMTAEAIRFLKEAIEIDGENRAAHFNLAQVYFYKEKNYNLAIRYYEKAKSMGFENNDLQYNLGLLYYYKRDFNKAVRQWTVLAELMPNNPNVNFALGSAFLHMEKYNSALGEFLILSEVYDELLKSLGEIRPWSAYHKGMVLGAASVYNNLGVAYQKQFERAGNPDYQKDSLVALYKAGEFADIMDTDRGIIQYNINYIIHPNVVRGGMAINDNISDNFRFVVR
jgi:tetratricopeptide (TPR) repeat protein